MLPVHLGKPKSFIGAPYQNRSEGLPLEREVIQRQQNHTNKKAKETKQKNQINQNKPKQKIKSTKPTQTTPKQIKPNTHLVGQSTFQVAELF